MLGELRHKVEELRGRTSWALSVQPYQAAPPILPVSKRVRLKVSQGNLTVASLWGNW